MTVKFLPVRQDIHDCFKNFPWASESQFETIWNYVDHQLAGQDRGRQAMLRSGMSELTDRITAYHLKYLSCYLEHFKEAQLRHKPKIDKRWIHQLAFDDTSQERAGRNVFASGYHYNHAHNNIDWGQVLVDLVHVSNRLVNVDYRPYLSQSFIERANCSQTNFDTKIKVVRQLFQEHSQTIIRQGLAPAKIWVSLDCWYASEELTTDVHQSGANLLQGVKKDTCCVLFGRLKRLDEIFTPKKQWYYRTYPHSGNRVYFQEKELFLNRHGKCKVFAVRRGNDPRIRY